MKHMLLLSLPLALLAGCSQNPAPAGNADDLAPAPTAAAALKTQAHLQAQRLQGQHWRLREATAADGTRLQALFARADAPLTLDFSDGRLSVSNACNRMSGPYTLDAGTLVLPAMASTEMACADPAIAALDTAVGSRLQGRLDAAVADNGELTLRTTQGDVLVFTPQATAETRYGGPGQVLFLEVAAHTRPCPHPVIKDMQCLQVREVRMDDNGIRQQEAGVFANFYDPIEGYRHEDGVRNVLRVKRFKVTRAPADASALAYVLDSVVESASEP